VNNPDILLLDEPTAGVDVALRHMLWDYLRTLHKAGKTILLTTHYIEEAELLCERVAIIDEGKIISGGKPEDLIKGLGKGGVEVSVTGWNPASENFLEDYNFAYEPNDSGGKLIFTVDEPEKSLTSILNVLSQNGCHIQRVNITRSSLEEVFVSLTGKELMNELDWI